MAKRVIMSVGINLSHPEIEYVSTYSKRSLLDGDIILFCPKLSLSSYEDFQGKPSLSDAGSFQVKEMISHWRQQILSAYDAGKTIIVILSEYQEFFVDTGQRTYSGTGRNRVTHRHVDTTNNYSMIPIAFKSVTNAIGERVAREKSITPIEYYWNSLGEHSAYVVYFESEKVKPLLKTADRVKIVAAYVRGKGHLVFVPPFNLEKGKEFGAKVLTALVAIDNEARAVGGITEAPGWSKDDKYRLKKEPALEQELIESSKEIDRLQLLRQSKSDELREYVRLRDLLFEKGPRLEEAVRIALRELGYEVSAVNDGESEIDVVFSTEGDRYIGEVEGKDSHAINIEKFSQLERNIQEDFSKEGTTEYASGVLFGNAFRLTNPADRGDWFTAKVLSAAKRSGVRLVKTMDLFVAAQHLRVTGDKSFAASCREALRTQVGTVVAFPMSSDPQKITITTDTL
jgi:hypothetical protein